MPRAMTSEDIVLSCTDCGAVSELAFCTVCHQPVCPEHRGGTGRLADGYQCTARDCWHVGYPFRRKPSSSASAMKWFNGQFEIERETVKVTCRYCGAPGDMTRDTYLLPTWPTGVAWGQPPEGWSVLQEPSIPGAEVIFRCGVCRPEPPEHIVLHHHLRHPPAPGTHLTLEMLRAVVFDLAEAPEWAREHGMRCEICRGSINRERLENPILQAEREEGTLPSLRDLETAVCELFTNALKLTYPGRKIVVTPAPFCDDIPPDLAVHLDGSGVVDVVIGALEKNPAWAAFRCDIEKHVRRREWSAAVQTLLEKARTELGKWRASPREVLAEAARRANWDAQQGPDHLRTGQYKPGVTQSSNEEPPEL